MHRVINKTPKGMDTDHINRDKLDNRKSNLRSVTRTINQYNRYIRKDNKSGYQGVYWDKSREIWSAYIDFNHKRLWLGYFENIKEAINARLNKESEFYGTI